MTRIGIIGGGAWGTALACVTRRAGAQAILWAREAEVVEAINAGRGNPIFLPNIKLESGITATTDIVGAVDGIDAVLLVAPAQHLRAVISDMASHLAPNTPIVICTKGIEQGSCALMSEVVAEVLPGLPIAVLSGPTFAAEVVNDLPTAVTLATEDGGLGEQLVAAIGTPRFRPYISKDPVGAQIGGAVKNVLAIACGIVAGRRLGDNARAALITRGIAEIARLGMAKGAMPETLMGLSGLGDLTLTCTGEQSRNMSLGQALGDGRKLEEILSERTSVTEGVFTAAAVRALAEKLGIEMPICNAVDDVINRRHDLDDVIAGLLARPFSSEGHTK
jgi:glycerol-3-phosphate dehydrogenase (NAD(P)+)